MILSFFLPTFLEHSQLEFVFYKQIQAFGAENLITIAPDYFFKDPQLINNRHINSVEYQIIREFSLPKFEELSKVHQIRYPFFLKNAFDKKYKSEIHKDKVLQEDSIFELEEWLDNVLMMLKKEGKVIEYVLTWRDCQSLKNVCKKHGFKIIHNEYGPLRKPSHEDCIYFDFSGCKSTNEVFERYEKAKSESSFPWLKLISNLDIFLPNIRNTNKDSNNNTILFFGVEEDKAFTNNYTNFDLIHFLKFNLNQEVNIKKHPWAKSVDYLSVNDFSEVSIKEIRNNINHGITIYSNAGFEFIIYGGSMEFIGSTPLKFLNVEHMNKEDWLQRVAFYTFNYMMPGTLLFDKDYIQFRLNETSETLIYDYHIKKYDELFKNNCLNKLNVKFFDYNLKTNKSLIL